MFLIFNFWFSILNQDLIQFSIFNCYQIWNWKIHFLRRISRDHAYCSLLLLTDNLKHEHYHLKATMDEVTPDEILNYFSKKKTYEEISHILQQQNPGKRGYSIKTIKRFCQKHGISTRVSQNHVKHIVQEAVGEVCCTKFLHFISSKNFFHISLKFQISHYPLSVRRQCNIIWRSWTSMYVETSCA